MIHIHNNFRRICCPFCHGKESNCLGPINYNQPLKFSTAIIRLDLHPELWRCLKCNSWYVLNAIPEHEAKAIYSGENSGGRWSQDAWEEIKPDNQLQCLRRYFRESVHVLDIGCNTGELLDFAKRLGCETTGIEYSRSSRDILQSKGHRVFSSIDQIEQSFDVITAFDLIEHLYDPNEFLKKCRQLLMPGGVLILLTGDIESNSARWCKSDWWYVGYPEHIVFPSISFFSRYSGFLILEKITTHASKWYQKPWFSSLVQMVIRVFLGKYKGLPSLSADHVLLVLRKEDEDVLTGKAEKCNT